jgi:hypothetical protein
VGGLVLPVSIALFASSVPASLPIAAALSIAGLLLHEWAFVMAPQEVPNS